MTDIPVSVIIVSWGRPQLLAKCLTAVLQLYYHPLEVVIVADRAGLAAVAKFDLQDRIKTAAFDDANISQARNIGLTLAAGTVVAFIDDDAVPEPGWLFHLAAVFEETEVMGAGGYTLGRNGISFQTTAQTIDDSGQTTPLDIPDNDPVIFEGKHDSVVKTEGTNCAFRRSAFMAAGGFDTNIRYFMDETDLNMRFSRMGYKTAIVPLAVVHHNRAESEQRSANLVPNSLLEIGASTAVYLRKHAAETDFTRNIKIARAVQRRLLLRHMIKGTCEPNDIPQLLRSFDEGVAIGLQRPMSVAPTIRKPISEYRPIFNKAVKTSHQIVSGYRTASTRLHAEAKSSVRRGNIVSLYIFSRTSLFHKTWFHPDGYWQQVGGLFGRSKRYGRIFQVTNRTKRTKNENKRIAQVRHPWLNTEPSKTMTEKPGAVHF